MTEAVTFNEESPSTHCCSLKGSHGQLKDYPPSDNCPLESVELEVFKSLF